MAVDADSIANTVIRQFQKLPPKRKPAIRDNGLRDWVPLSGIVAEVDGRMICLALATGMKCLPSAKLAQSHGVALHDWHAEVLAIRTFNRFLLDECHCLASGKDGSGILARRVVNVGAEFNEEHTWPFEIREGVKLHMYCSEAPCGDGSMELIMAAQDDASPWAAPSQTPQAESQADNELLGRACFSQLGVVRRKPARGDAPPTLSKSCSDKLALKQCLSLLSSLTSLFVHPRNAYINTLVLPKSQFSASAFERAFSPAGRMQPVANSSWSSGYTYRPFAVAVTDIEFEYSRRAFQDPATHIAASNLAAAWSLSKFDEGIIGGVLQGRKAFDRKGASRMSRLQLWQLCIDLAGHLADFPELEKALGPSVYQEVKDGRLLAERRRVKSDVCRVALRGWIKNEGGSNFRTNHKS
ncbi:adenosine-deaminase domain-containing protein [Stachybotrys elegans]|uniref:Adenosine-deaminase domain-containing protein n=1 Tax=Stachybotrys elegans TaxID=80388 RepID=A0A8K0SIC4_9HYPO|nr:adenosine-deaminase domain-containing protein [Stachybotrys elegans]